MEIAQIKSVALAFQYCKFIHQIHAWVSVYLLGSTCIDSGENRMNEGAVLALLISLIMWILIKMTCKPW